jgi:class 3 adenylate cyclase
MKRLLQEIDRLRCLLLKWASAGVWFACLALAIVIIWGGIDPFGLRQRLDWLASDQFLRARRAPPIHQDLVLVAIDDGSVEHFGSFPIPRSILAGAIRQLNKLGARTVLVDILLTEPQRSPVLEEAKTWLLPAGSVISNAELSAGLLDLQRRFTEDQVLARALRPARSIVIPFSFQSQEALRRSGGTSDAADERLLARVSDALHAKPDLGPAALASQLGLDINRVRPLFMPALDAAMARLAQQHIENPAAGVEHVLEAALPPEVRDSYVGVALRRAFDRVSAERVVFEKSALPSHIGATSLPGVTAEEVKPPRYILADAAAALGFADIQLDDDGTLRRIPLVGSCSTRLLFHQSLVALLLHRRVGLGELRFERGLIRTATDSDRIPVDSSSRLTIDWPADRIRRWNEVIPALSLMDVQQLDQYESDLNRNRHRRREYFKEMARSETRDPAWEEQFHQILAAQRQGQPEETATLENAFDTETLPRIQQMPRVQDALEHARNTNRPGMEEPSEPAMVQYAREILDLEQGIAEIYSEYQATFAQLLPIVRDKLCVIGDTTTGSADLKRTPVDEAVPGVAVIVAAISTMLAGNSLVISGYAASTLVLVVLAGGLILPFLRFGALWAGACALVAMAAAFFGSYFLLRSFSTFISPVTPLLGLGAVYLTTTTYQWLEEYREKRLVRTIFEAQTNPTIVDRLIEAGHAGVAEVLAPKNRQLTVFFAEIADYDELAQRVMPERLPELLSRTFGTMAKVVLAHEGTLDRYQGHAMVAFFGAPVYQADHAQRACQAALECCDTLAGLASTWHQRGLPIPRVQVGLHTGELLVGNITLTSRVDYTVAGENLNVAYRIGELNEQYGTQIMISEATLARCDNMVESRELDMVRIKGRREPIRAFELMSAKGRLTLDQLQMRGAFCTGLIAFRNKDFAGALAMFRSCRETSPQDRPATVYIERCERELSATSGAATTGAHS